MAEMKDSGTAWLGMIPKDWELSKISSIYELRTQKVSDKDYPPLSVTMNGIVPQLDSAAKTNAHDDRKLVKKGDFAINSRSDRRGSCGVSEYDGSVSLINTVMKPRDEMNPDYYNWLFHTIQFADEFYKWGHGIVDDLWTTNWQDMKHIDIPVPTLDEQKVIADYLNKAIPEIDALHTDIEKQIETLEEYKKSIITEAVTRGLDPNVEMKDSGIEWIGMIPKDWSTIRIGHVFSLRNERNSLPEDQVQLLSLYTGIGVFPQGEHVTASGNHAQTVDGYKIVHKNDIVVNIILAWMGAIGVSDYDGVTSPAYDIYIPDLSKVVPHYFHYVFRTAGIAGECYKYGRGIMMMRWRTYSQEFKQIFVPFPSLEKQQEIAEYLDKKCAEIDGAIEEKKQQLETLEQYKKSLIYEYVTGKKEVQ
jgi:type I restriction enzyme S subunit